MQGEGDDDCDRARMVENIDVSDLVEGHGDYRRPEVLREIILRARI